MTTDVTEDLTGLEPSARSLLDAVIAMSSELDLSAMLERITRSACELTGAGYGALGILDLDGDLQDLITYGHQQEPTLQVVGRSRGRRARVEVDSAPEEPDEHLTAPEALRMVAPRESDGGGNHALRAGDPGKRKFLEVPLRIKDHDFGHLLLSEKIGGADFTSHDEQLVVALARAAGAQIDKVRELDLSEQRRKWLEASAELSRALTPPLEHTVALERMCETALPLMRAIGVGAGTRIEHGLVSGVAAVPGEEERVRAVTEKVPLLIDRRIVEPLDLEVDGLYVVVAPVRSTLAGRGALLAIYDKSCAAHDEHERELFFGFAGQAALALDRLRAVEDRADLAVITDRDRIARDLHDVVIQRLFAIGLQLETLGRAPERVEDLPTRLSEQVDALDQTIKDVRGSIFDLSNHDASSLRAQVREVVREYAGVMEFTPEIKITGPVDTAVPEAVRNHLLPVLREAVSNLARHAQAHSAQIELSLQDDEIKLVVRDDGTGVPEEAEESGLKNARCRAVQLGGQLEIGPRDPSGTELVWQVPITAGAY
ncbi:signal transduction histidine kinase [Nocardioides luteus]|uniref:Histidine kinase n=1 Tax=Nocardioides luteus TaxID=1844 RepID=A0ABQ5SVS7_9ACTN|nr:histidine kinase [Nocardioides luteus]MDR7309307.1 signal transduction histidine kinase [Nocardioides luteus]GGR69977.1 histidine kinase [Nocardioides luteus]GLJ67713.1 histidine kinase [Nocardioides luteus]